MESQIPSSLPHIKREDSPEEALTQILNNVKIKPFQCDECSACFTLKYNLAVHMKSHHGEELPSFDCPDPRCDVTCTTKFNLVAHVQRAHPRRKNFTAEKAEKQYKPIKKSEKKEPKRKVNRTVVYCPLCPSIITGRC